MIDLLYHHVHCEIIDLYVEYHNDNDEINIEIGETQMKLKVYIVSI